MSVDYHGNQKWKNEYGFPHREDGPAIIYRNGTKEWHQYGQLHREDGPAKEVPYVPCYLKYAFGLQGLYFRLKAWWYAEQYFIRYWFREGQLHREDGPAVECLDYSEWYMNDKLHRMNGPAITWGGGLGWWYRYGVESVIGKIICLTIAISPLELPPYIWLWILEWINPEIMNMNQPRLVALLEGIRNSRMKIKGIVS